MEEDVVPKSVLGDGIVHIVRPEGHPVVIEFLRTEHKDRFVAALVVFDNRKRGKCLTKANAIS